MPIKSVVTRGFGNGTFNGDISLASVRGYLRVVKGGGANGSVKAPKQKAVPKQDFELKPIGEIDEYGREILYKDIKKKPRIKREVDLAKEARFNADKEFLGINQNLSRLNVIQERKEKRIALEKAKRRLTTMQEEEAILLLLLANNQ